MLVTRCRRNHRAAGRASTEAALRLDFLHDILEFVHLARAEHEVDMRRAGDQRVALLLRHAARDAENQARILPFEMLDLADLAIHAVLRTLADAARIDEDEVGRLHLVRTRVADGRKLPRHALGVRDIHLTAIDEQVCFFIMSLHKFD